MVGVPIEYDFSGTIDQALRWHPRARRLVVVTGASFTGPRMGGPAARARSPVSRTARRSSFSPVCRPAQVLERLGELGGRRRGIHARLLPGRRGPVRSPRAKPPWLMAAAATAPVYAPFDTFMGTGIVGGCMPSFEAMGRQAGQIVNALFDGVAPAALRLPEIMPTDAQRRLATGPAGGASTDRRFRATPSCIFKAPSFLRGAPNRDGHRRRRVPAAGGADRRAPRRAPSPPPGRAGPSSNHRFELAHASRLAIAGELTGAIAHEINQPLGAILSNADAAEMLLESGR
ncbi:MAG: hypothetical protein MZW92_10795 [Comamonadaceae bacterium]|nr:hypothetical protein [Comamonadaceae bacterium]